MGDLRTDQRRRWVCRDCGLSQYPFDQWLGIDRSSVTPHARELIVLAGQDFSFDQASDRLMRYCGMQVSDQTIRRITLATGQLAGQWMMESDQAVELLRTSPDEGEVYTDGMKVNTTEGWREIRLTCLARRPSAEPATPKQWADRTLPKPSAILMLCKLGVSEEVGRQIEAATSWAGMHKGKHCSFLADAACWIWNQVKEKLPLINCVLDVYHLLERLYLCADAMTVPTLKPAWVGGELQRLMTQGPIRYLKRLKIRIDQAQNQSKQEALSALYTYMWPMRDAMWYGDRLKRGRPIGSGLIEGGCKSVLGRRLKINNPRWRPENTERIGSLRCLKQSDLWDKFWSDPDIQPGPMHRLSHAA